MQGQVSRRAQTSEEFAGDLKVPERTQAKHEEMNFHFSRPHTVLTVALLDEIGLKIGRASCRERVYATV